VAANAVLVLAVTIKVSMLRTAAGRSTWQAKVHAALYQAYLAQRAEYDRAVAERLASAVQIRGRNPLRNEELVRIELRRGALSVLTGANLAGGTKLVASEPEGYPEPRLEHVARDAARIRFFEQAFEWEQMTFTFLPYYWGAKEGWKDRVLLDDVDDLFARFLRAGAVRVAFPARPNFEAAVLHYLDTGELWAEGNPPPIVSERYLPLLEELRKAATFPPEGIPVGEAWEIRVPTTLVKLRPDDKLPRWIKQNGSWIETAADDGDD
jgi:hypothetical protein